MRSWNLLDTVFFAAFLIWSAAGLAFTLQHVTPNVIAHWNLPAGLARFITGCLQNGDPILILLACANTHFYAALQWTPATARRWAAIILVCSYGVETLGAWTGFPFGEYHYTDKFGPILGVVPLAIPLAWYVVVSNTLFIVRIVAPYLSQVVEAVLAALLCTLYDFVLEPFATTVKHYWNWAGETVPPLNYVAWFVVSGLLIWLFSPTLTTRFRLDLRPWIILGATLLIFVAGQWNR